MTTAQTERLHDAAFNAVAVASIAYQQHLNALRHILGKGLEHGLTAAELCEASGMDTVFIGRLLAEESA